MIDYKRVNILTIISISILLTISFSTQTVFAVDICNQSAGERMENLLAVIRVLGPSIGAIFFVIFMLFEQVNPGEGNFEKGKKSLMMGVAVPVVIAVMGPFLDQIAPNANLSDCFP